jgi:hypothetical protein
MILQDEAFRHLGDISQWSDEDVAVQCSGRECCREGGISVQIAASWLIQEGIWIIGLPLSVGLLVGAGGG